MIQHREFEGIPLFVHLFAEREQVLAPEEPGVHVSSTAEDERITEAKEAGVAKRRRQERNVDIRLFALEPVGIETQLRAVVHRVGKADQHHDTPARLPSKRDSASSPNTIRTRMRIS